MLILTRKPGQSLSIHPQPGLECDNLAEQLFAGGPIQVQVIGVQGPQGVHASGICGAQLSEISGAKGPDPWLPHLLGHEGGGVVVETGPGVSQVKAGDHVVMHWRKGAGIDAKPPRYRWETARLRFCRADMDTVGGGWVTTFNEYAVVSENRLTKIGNDIPFEIAALMGCAVTTALGLVNNEAKLKIGESIAVAGAGGVGLNVIQGAAMVGGNPIYAIDSNDSKSSMALQAGATSFSNSLAGMGKVDVFVDCTGSVEVISAAYDLIKTGGRFILVGQPDHGLLPLVWGASPPRPP